MELIQTKVTEIHRGEVISYLDDKKIKVKVPGTLLNSDKTERNYVTVGDDIVVYYDNKSKCYILKEKKERKNQISRVDPFLKHISHVIAANIDYLGIVVSLKEPDISYELIDRYIITAEKYNIDCVLILNKSDLITDEELDYLPLGTYEDLGVEIFLTCTLTGDGIDDLKEFLKGKTTLFSGQSGCGKSSLVNLFEPEIVQKTSEISEKGQSGRHTTRSTKLIKIKGGGYLIDSPGIQGLGLDKITEIDIKSHYREFYPFLEKCKYANCTHTHENICGVTQAVKNNEIEEFRYANYYNILTNPNISID